MVCCAITHSLIADMLWLDSTKVFLRIKLQTMSLQKKKKKAAPKSKMLFHNMHWGGYNSAVCKPPGVRGICSPGTAGNAHLTLTALSGVSGSQDCLEISMYKSMYSNHQTHMP